jgi:hypothetical protein
VLERVVHRHGGGNYGDFTLKLIFPRNPNGLYLIKGGRSDVWRRLRRDREYWSWLPLAPCRRMSAY